MDIDALYARHRVELLTFLVRRCGDTQVALDLWAETFACAYAGRERFRGRTAEEAAGWLFAIARKQLALYLRKGAAQQRALRRLGMERPPAGPDVVAEIERRAQLDDLRRQVADALATLSERNRRAVELRVVHEMPYPEVAQRLGVTEVTARARVSRALQALAATIDSQSIEEMTCP